MANGRTMGRPSKPIDWVKAAELLECHGTGTELAAYFDVHPTTFYDRCVSELGITFTEFSHKSREKGKLGLRKAQRQNAFDGNTSMQIWLGKNWLDQRENPQQDIQVTEVMKKTDALIDEFKAYRESRNSSCNNNSTECKS